MTPLAILALVLGSLVAVQPGGPVASRAKVHNTVVGGVLGCGAGAISYLHNPAVGCGVGAVIGSATGNLATRR